MTQNPQVFLTKDQITNAVGQCAEAVENFLQKKPGPAVMVCILKGAVFFFSDVMKRLAGSGYEIDFCRLASYENSSSLEHVHLLLDCTNDLRNKHVVVFEDIVDTGYTIDFLRKHFSQKGVASIMFCALLDKPSRRKISVSIDFVGHTVPDAFVVGYGLDYNQKYRLFNEIRILESIS